MKKQILINGISTANNWSNAVKMTDCDVEKLAMWLKKQIPFESLPSTIPLKIEESTLDLRSRACFNGALSHTLIGEYGDAIHEIHDFIYGYGQKLDSDMSNLEWMMLGTIVNHLLEAIKN